MRGYRQRKREAKTRRERLEHKEMQLYAAEMRLMEQKQRKKILKGAGRNNPRHGSHWCLQSG